MSPAAAVAQWPLQIVQRDYSARRMRTGEKLPDKLIPGFQGFPLDPEWIWVYDGPKGPQASLICSNMHGIALLWSLNSLDDAKVIGVRKLLRRCFLDLQLRGIEGYMCLLDPDILPQKKLMRLIIKYGGQQYTKGILFAGRTDLLPLEG